MLMISTYNTLSNDEPKYSFSHFTYNIGNYRRTKETVVCNTALVIDAEKIIKKDKTPYQNSII